MQVGYADVNMPPHHIPNLVMSLRANEQNQHYRTIERQLSRGVFREKKDFYSGVEVITYLEHEDVNRMNHQRNTKSMIRRETGCICSDASDDILVRRQEQPLNMMCVD
jgi:hypothetical protein